MGAFRKLVSATNQGFSPSVCWLLNTYQHRGEKSSCFYCINWSSIILMDKTKEKTKALGRLTLACQSQWATSARAPIWAQVPLAQSPVLVTVLHKIRPAAVSLLAHLSAFQLTAQLHISVVSPSWIWLISIFFSLQFSKLWELKIERGRKDIL